MCEDEGFDFDMMLQAQQANTRLQAFKHELLESDSSGEESIADVEVNAHVLSSKIKGLLEFSEDELDIDTPGAMEEALAHDARGEIDDPDLEINESIKRIKQKSMADMFKGMLHFSDSEDEDEAAFQLRAQGFTSSIEEAIATEGDDALEGTGNEGIVGEQEGNISSLADSNPDRRRLIDEFCSQDGLMHFSDSDDEAEEEVEVETKKEETKVMTRSR